MKILIRPYNSTDCQKLADLFYQTVHSVNAKDYTPDQLHAWATGYVDLCQWDKSFTENYTLIAETDDEIVGFGDIDKNGYLNRLFVHRDYQGIGIATAICDKLETTVDVSKIVTEASITARPFFEKRGYILICEQQVERNGMKLTNYLMEKDRRKHHESNSSN